MKIVAWVERNNEIGTDTETPMLINLREEIDTSFTKSSYPYFSPNYRHVL